VYQRAIIRAPSKTFARGLTTVELGEPDYERAISQHDAYCNALLQCGLEITRQEADERYPDSTFVEDTALLTTRGAILARPGAPERAGEVDAMANVLAKFYSELHYVQSPATLDAGDVCEAGDHFFIGISKRTNRAGAKQLVDLLTRFGYTTSLVNILGVTSILHLKSGIAFLGANRLVAIDALASNEAFRDYELIQVPTGDEYAANCVRVNDRVLVAAGHPKLETKLKDLGYQTTALEMSEFRKMDGGLSCLSLRF
jgi:dimethylargininase